MRNLRWGERGKRVGVCLVVMPVFAAPAAAVPSGQVEALCADACGIEFDRTSREGVTTSAVVHGAPNVPVTIRAYHVRLDGNRIAAFDPYSDPIRGVTGVNGVARLDVGLGWLPEGETGGFVFIGPADIEAADLSQTIGTFTVLGAASPILLGDGYGDEKPVGEVLDLRYYAAAPYARYAVDYRRDDGQWQEVTTKAQAADVAESPDEIGHVRYEVPRGLNSKPYEFRLRNIGVGSVVAEWMVTPSLNPPSKDRGAVWTPPEVGTGLDNVMAQPSHNLRLVIGLAAAGTTVALGVIAASWVTTMRRRRRLSSEVRP